MPISPPEHHLAIVIHVGFPEQGEGTNAGQRKLSRQWFLGIVEVDKQGLVEAGFDEAVGVAVVGHDLLFLVVSMTACEPRSYLNVLFITDMLQGSGGYGLCKGAIRERSVNNLHLGRSAGDDQQVVLQPPLGRKIVYQYSGLLSASTQEDLPLIG